MPGRAPQIHRRSAPTRCEGSLRRGTHVAPRDRSRVTGVDDHRHVGRRNRRQPFANFVIHYELPGIVDVGGVPGNESLVLRISRRDLCLVAVEIRREGPVPRVEDHH